MGRRRQAPRRRAPRLWPLRVVLGVLALGFSKACYMAIWRREDLHAIFPALTPTLEALMVVSLAAGIVGLAGLWFQRRWGLLLLVAAGVLGLVLDVLARGPVLHFATSAALLALVAILAAPLWRRPA